MALFGQRSELLGGMKETVWLSEELEIHPPFSFIQAVETTQQF